MELTSFGQNVWFQEISTSPSQRVIGNSEKEGVLKAKVLGLPRCKNLTRFSLFGSFCFAVRYCLKCFCFLCFTSSVSFTGSYTEVKPKF